MRIGSKQGIDAYKSQNVAKSSGSQVASERKQERLDEHLKKTREVLLGESAEEVSFAEILQKISNVQLH
jgi:hypothetical protein